MQINTTMETQQHLSLLSEEGQDLLTHFLQLFTVYYGIVALFARNPYSE